MSDSINICNENVTSEEVKTGPGLAGEANNARAYCAGVAFTVAASAFIVATAYLTKVN